MTTAEEKAPETTTLKKSSCAERISVIMRTLMKEQGLRESELARRVNLPQTTINRLLVGHTEDPRANTLRPIAQFFGISVGQLIGDEQLPEKRYTGTRVLAQWAKWASVPVIEWNEIWGWTYQRDRVLSHRSDSRDWLNSERKLSEHAFALRATPFMEPRFTAGSLILIDPEVLPCDGNFIIVSFNGEEPTIRQVLKDGCMVYLKPFDPSLPTVQLSNMHLVYGTVIEMRYGFDMDKN